MWHAELTRKEIVELCLGGYDPRLMRIDRTDAILITSFSGNFDAYWMDNPATVPALPTMIITPDGEAQQFLVALSASPQAPIPFTALCRVLTREEARTQFNEPSEEFDETLLRATAVLCMAEAVLHSEGKFTLKTLGPAACRRTVAFAWARACATGARKNALDVLVRRWTETYALMGHSPSSLTSIGLTVNSVLGVLRALFFDRDGRSFHADGQLAIVQAIIAGNERAIAYAWQALARELSLSASLEEILAASREERGGFLQQALRLHATTKPGSSATVGCAFLATLVAPKSLEHLEILRSVNRPELVFWYALLASLQYPLPILTAYGSLGFRILRDIKRIDDPVSAPTADIAYQELQTISRLGLEALGKRLGHVGEIEVELVPLVSATFSFPSRTGRSEVQESPAREARSVNGLNDQTRARIYDALNSIAKLIEEPPEEFALASPQAPARRSYRKKGV
jgi:hypothetical protein